MGKIKSVEDGVIKTVDGVVYALDSDDPLLAYMKPGRVLEISHVSGRTSRLEVYEKRSKVPLVAEERTIPFAT